MDTVKVSIVIPVYNEAGHLADCLQSISRQSTKPYEVIVVDNNSTDNSVAIAKRFPFVRILHEARQGVVYARGTGFDAASGDIIGRIDADTVLTPGWVKSLQSLFRDDELNAVSGSVAYYDLPWRRALSRIDLGFRQWIADGMGPDVFLYGSNMALRKEAWWQVRKEVCLQGGLHEDFDLSIHLRAAGLNVSFDRRLMAEVSMRRSSVAFKNFLHYVWLSPQTYRSHDSTSHYRMYPVLALAILFHPLIRLSYRLYDPRSDTVAVSNAFNKRPNLRVNPATYVD